MAEPIPSLTINEKPTPKPRPSRRRAGFYTSLCSDINDFEIYETSTAVSDNPQSAFKKDANVKKKPKKVKVVQGKSSSKYYASLAEDIASMKLEQVEQQKEVKQKNDASVTKKQSVANGMKQVEKDLGSVPLSDEEPPKWFEKVLVKVSLLIKFLISL